MGRRLDRLETTMTDVLGETARIPEEFTEWTLTPRIKYMLADARFCKEGYVISGTEGRQRPDEEN